ncbi:MAG TPA: DUF488 domain-containing protein [Candidatus Latescibacteria bacterium]|nr:DUF488 domain-containing protein [Candidatus Latescibacterota bacterium]
MELYTIGHSTRSFAELVALLERYGIKTLVDVRTFPTSARNPQFTREELEQRLRRKGIEYHWLGEELGGYRREGLGARSPNRGWESEGFRNYADYMLTVKFEQGVERLLELAASGGLAYMCAERFWWRCHRRLISDYLVAKGHKVIHIVDETKAVEHKLPAFAEVSDGRLRYPAVE